MAIVPDSKDWTWVLDRPCGECGYDAARVDRADIPRLVRESTAAIRDALRRTDVGQRPDESTWSVPEYGCHVRADQDRTAVESLGRYLLHDLVHHVHDVSSARR